MVTTKLLIANIRANGNDARDLRDAAHEAHHAIEAGVPAGKWDRETIHRHVTRMGRARAAASEVMARAVEQLVCADFGIDCGTVEHWAFLACMEALKGGVSFPGVDWFAQAVRRAMATHEARTAADAVKAVQAPAKARKRRMRA